MSTTTIAIVKRKRRDRSRERLRTDSALCGCGCGAHLTDRRSTFLRGHNKLKPMLLCKRGHPMTDDNVYQIPNGNRVCRICKLERGTRWHREDRFKLTPEKYEALARSQNYECAVCFRPFSDIKVVVDHDHACCSGHKTCGKCVRGLICQKCNVLLPSIDNEQWLASALNYTDSYHARRRHDGTDG